MTSNTTPQKSGGDSQEQLLASNVPHWSPLRAEPSTPDVQDNEVCLCLPSDRDPRLDRPAIDSYCGLAIGRCLCRLSGRACAICATGLGVTAIGVFLIVLFVGGGNIAQTSLDDAGVTIDSMSMRDFTENGFELNLIGTLDNRSPLAATMHTATTTMLYKGNSIGSMTLPEQSLPAGGQITLNVTNTVSVSVDQNDAFNDFSAELMAGKDVTLGMQATVSVSAMGVTFSNLDLKKTVTIKGFDSFLQPAPQVIRSAVVNSTADSIEMQLTVELTNAASVQMFGLGPLQFSLHSSDTLLGIATTIQAPNTTTDMTFGVNTYTARAVLKRPANKAAFLEVLSNYSSGLPSAVTMKGMANDQNPALLAPALKSLSTKGVLPGLTQPLLASALDPDFNPFPPQDPGQCSYLGSLSQNATFSIDYSVHNVLDIPVTVKALNLFAIFKGSTQQSDPPLPQCSPSPNDYLEVLSGRNPAMNLAVPAKKKVTYTQKMCDLSGDPKRVKGYNDFLVCLATLAGSGTFVVEFGVKGTIHGCLGDFCANIAYSQASLMATNIPAS